MSNQEALQALIAAAPSIENASHFDGIFRDPADFISPSAATSSTICKPLIYGVLSIGGIDSFIIQTVLVLRTYALWDCNKKILWFLMGLNVIASLGQEGLAAAIWGRNVVSTPYNPLPRPYTSCFITFHLGTWERYIPIIVFELGMAFLMILKFVSYVRQGRGHRVLYVLFRDGFIEFTGRSSLSLKQPDVYFLLVNTTGSSILGIILGLSNDPYGNGYITHVAYDIMGAISMVCCARMLLNIRDVLSLSDPLDTTKPNPWTLSPSFDQRYGRDPHVFAAVPEMSQVEMFETFFRSSEQILDHSEQVDEVLPRISNISPPRAEKGKGVLKERAKLQHGSDSPLGASMEEFHL
ncbi:hypothetical protein DL93DRAFT_2230684 [Clavulina sp. PMI_390]|nr:hypothetical protein DL93DRAFT_2230684 [Clavulina sp. PMI_390]